MYKRRYHKKRIMFAGVFSFVFAATFAFLSTANQDKTEAASTANFKAGNIISDAVMTDYNSMTVDQIHAFLKSKNSCNQSADPAAIGATRYENVNTTKHGITYNRRYFFRNSSGGENSGLYHVKDGHFVCMADETINGHSAAYVIWDAAQAFKINPKVLIVLLEKEQSLVTDKWPYEVQYRAATGYGCPDSAACDSKYYGLEAQVGNAAYLFGKIVYENKHNYYPVGKNYVKYHYDNSCGGSVVNIENRATGALYTYTPYQPNAASLAAGYGLASGGCGAYGNRNFFLLYSDWFGDPRAKNNVVTKVESALPITYRSHVQNIGWESIWKQDTATSGTTGRSLRLEAVNIKLVNNDEQNTTEKDAKEASSTKDIHIYYRSHLQNIGWEQKWKQDGEISGTTGEARRLEAIEIKLDEASSKLYDIYYRSHVQDYGWMAWTRNGEPSGSEGFAKRLEALEVVIVKKGDMPVSNNANSLKGFIKK